MDLEFKLMCRLVGTEQSLSNDRLQNEELLKNKSPGPAPI
jgi:hypothetical protein